MTEFNTPAARVAEFVRQAMLLRDVDRHKFYNVHTDPESDTGANLSLYDLAELVTDAKPETVDTVEGLNALVPGTFLTDADGGPWVARPSVEGGVYFVETGGGHIEYPHGITLPAIVRYTPEVQA